MLNQPKPRNTRLGAFGTAVTFVMATILLPMARGKSLEEKAGPILQTVRVEVPARTEPGEEWIDTGMSVSRGEILVFKAKGKATHNTEVGYSSADGNPSHGLAKRWSNQYGTHLHEEAPLGALVSKIGEKGEPFLVGQRRSIRAPVGGTLFLGFNDSVEYRDDNAGSFSVHIELRSVAPSWTRTRTVSAEGWQPPKDFKATSFSEYFSFYGRGGIDWKALGDPNNGVILTACISGGTDESLEDLGLTDLQQRLKRLELGNLIKRIEGGYALAFPAIVGNKRERLRKYAVQVAHRLTPFGKKMVTEIRPHLGGRDEMLYHVLWSVIMDGDFAWTAARKEMSRQIQSGDVSSHNKGWMLHPTHAFRVGTNTYRGLAGNLHITWSRNTPSPHTIWQVLKKYGHSLLEVSEQDGVVRSEDARETLGQYGLVDRQGRTRLYMFASSSKAGEGYMTLGIMFGQQVMKHLDVAKIAGMLDVSPGVAFVIAYHEVCWQLLQDLYESKVLNIPKIVLESGVKPEEAYQLVSLAARKRTGRRETAPLAQHVQAEVSDEEKAVFDQFLQTVAGDGENMMIEKFNAIKLRILAGEDYFNLSTPVDALLSYISALVLEDEAALRQSNATLLNKEGPLRPGSFSAVHSRKRIHIHRIPPEPENPSEGDVHPVYVMYGSGQTYSDVYVFIYYGGKWRFLFNEGNPRTDWRKTVESTRTGLKPWEKLNENR